MPSEMQKTLKKKHKPLLFEALDEATLPDVDIDKALDEEAGLPEVHFSNKESNEIGGKSTEDEIGQPDRPKKKMPVAQQIAVKAVAPQPSTVESISLQGAMNQPQPQFNMGSPMQNVQNAQNPEKPLINVPTAIGNLEKLLKQKPKYDTKTGKPLPTTTAYNPYTGQPVQESKPITERIAEAGAEIATAHPIENIKASIENLKAKSEGKKVDVMQQQVNKLQEQRKSREELQELLKKKTRLKTAMENEGK